MRPTLLFTLVILGLLALAAAPAHAQDNVIPLELHQSKHIVPGYEVTVELHAFGMTAMPIPISHAFADAGVEFQGHRYGIVGTDGGGPTVEVFYLIDGEKIKIDEFHYGKKEYDAYVKITAYCPGERPAGAPTAPPGDDWFWVRVDFNGQYTRWNLIQLGGEGVTAVPLQLFYEQAPGLESWAHVSDSIHFKDCGNVIGEPPSPGDDTRDDNDHGLDLPWKWLGLAVVGLLIILLIKI